LFCLASIGSLGVVMKTKISFVSGVVLGLLAGSRIGPELYRRVSSAVSSLAADPRVRKGATSAGDRAAQAARSAGTSAAHQVKHAGEVVAHRFGGRFGDRFSAVAHSTTNGASHGGTGRFDDESFGE
jgi:hypothetical protein